MKILTTDEVIKIGKLSNIPLTDKEIKKFASELNATIKHIKSLDEIDLKGIMPIFHITGLKNKLRKDRILPSLSQEEALSQAPDTHNGYFKVKFSLRKDDIDE